MAQQYDFKLICDKYTLWFHSPNEESFDANTFKKVCDIMTSDDFLALNYALLKKDDLLLNGLFYFMKNDIQPVWNNDEHINGGSISWKIDKFDAIKCWINILNLFVSGKFDSMEQYGITGISINPKKNCNILKIWFNGDIPDENLAKLELPEECIFRENFKIFKRFKTFF